MIRKPRISIFSFLCSLSFYAQASSINETQLFHLLHPTFEELISEVIEQRVTNYISISDEVIDEALDKHFHRIEYMSFSKQEK